MSLSECPNCCPNCLVNGPGIQAEEPIFSLSNLLPIGTVSLAQRGPPICYHLHCDDDWHSMSPLDHISNLVDSDEDKPTLLALQFLAKHDFIRTTTKYVFGTLLIRVYLVPNDLPGARGRLSVQQRKKQILSGAQRHYNTLFRKVVPDQLFWEGRLIGTSKNTVLDIDNRSLAEIYSNLPSPCALPGVKDAIVRRLLREEDNLNGLGLRSTLYKYQRRSVASMITYELSQATVPDPLYVPLCGVNGQRYFLQPGTFEILRESPMISPIQGGILCEELGTGKTLIILALILATRNQLPQPESTIGQPNPAVMTPVALRHFPENFANERKRFPRSSRRRFSPTDVGRVPSLREILIHKLAVSPCPQLSKYDTTKVSLEKDLALSQYQEIVRANPAFYLHYVTPTIGDPSARSSRRIVNAAPRLLYLTTATLVVVPPNLLAQWDREIQKHCEYPLRVLILRTESQVPPANLLAINYDASIVLTTYNKLGSENHRRDIDSLCTWKMCGCPEFSAVGVPNCSCKPSTVSPLLQVRWKRMVIDEGHVSASVTSNLISFSNLLSVERRWIVTGTPTTNLLGLKFGAKPEEKQVESENGAGESFGEIEEENFGHDDIEQDEGALFSSDSVNFTDLESPLPDPPRIWSRSSDTQDIRKLMDMLTHFLGMKSFANTARTHVINAVADSLGPRPGAIVMLRQLMHLTMIRHDVEDIEKEVVLPDLKEESIFLDLDPYGVKTFNAFQGGLAINAVDSERTGQDYIFDHQNVKLLITALKNMSQILFWSPNDEFYWVDENVEYAERVMKNAQERQVPEEDVRLLREALRHMKVAAEDTLWKAFLGHEDVPFRLSNMSRDLLNVWSRTHSNTDEEWIHLDRLLRLRNAVNLRPLRPEEFFVELGEEVAKADEIFRLQLKKKKRASSNAGLVSRISKISEGEHKKVLLASALATSSETIKEMQEELDVAVLRMEDESNGVKEVPVVTPRQSSTLLSKSVISRTRVHSSASAKLNYILNEVLEHSATEKFLIFSESPLTLTYIREGLELIGVKFLHFTSAAKIKYREQFVLTFETSETYRVFLMELKHGARGLNLISASRIIFCEPVWQPDVESQAIKRAHRIGQTKNITVKTLAIRNTFEENMVYRRNELKGLEKAPKLINEAGMRQYLQATRFLECRSVPSILDISLIDTLLPPSIVTHDDSDSDTIVVSGSPTRTPKGKRAQPLESEEDQPSPVKKRRIVRFA